MNTTLGLNFLICFINPFLGSNILQLYLFLICLNTAFAVFNNIVDLDSQFDHWKKIIYDKGRGEVSPDEWLNKTMPTYDFQSKLFPKGGAGIDKTLTDMLNIIPGLKPRIKYSNPRMGITGTISPPWFPKVKSLGLENEGGGEAI